MFRKQVRRVGDRLAARIAAEVKSSRDEYFAIAELRQRYATSEQGLDAHELRVFSQNGEDGVLAEILARIGVDQRSFVEFGVEDGVQCNTRFLAEVLHWSGVYFESDPATFDRLAGRLVNRPDLQVVRSMVTPENVNELFHEARVPVDFDLLSIDVDGQDYWIWRAVEGFRPRVVVIEYNSALPADARLVEPRGRSRWTTLTDYYGASLGAMEALGIDKGYRLVHAELAGVNAFFVREDLAAPFPDAPLLRGPNFGLSGQRHPPEPDSPPYERV